MSTPPTTPPTGRPPSYSVFKNPTFWVAILGLPLLVPLATLANNAFESCREGGIACSGQVGDTLGGISNFVTMIVVVISALYAFREVERGRRLHSEEVRADAAREVWRAAYGLSRDLHNLLGHIKPVHKMQEVEIYVQDLRNSFVVFRDALADASMFFDPAVIDGLAALLAIRDRVDIVVNGKRKGSEDLDEVDRCMNDLAVCGERVRELLRPHATLTSA